MDMNATKSTTSVLNHLIEICKDGQDGFRAASESAHNTNLKTLFGEYSLQRSKFAGELQQLVHQLGEKEEKTSSFTSAVHRGWIDLRAALTKGEGHEILVECERGEDHAVEAYQEALTEELPVYIRSVIQAQYAEIQAAHDQIRNLRDAGKKL